MMKLRHTLALIALLPCAAVAGFAPRLTTTIDASAQMTPNELSMAQAADQDFAFDFTNLQTSFNASTDSCVWYYTDECYTNWQVAVTGTVEDADTVVISVDPAHSNTNTAQAGFFPWRLEVQDSSGTIIAKGYGSLTIEKSPVAAGTPALVTTTNINTADYTVTGQWPASSIPSLTNLYETAATNGQGTAGQVFATDGNGNNYWTTSGGDITAVNVAGGLLSGGGSSGDVTITLTTGAVNSAESDPTATPLITNHIADASAAHAASAVSFTPAGTIAATDVQAMGVELDTEKAGLAQDNTFTGATNTFTGDVWMDYGTLYVTVLRGIVSSAAIDVDGTQLTDTPGTPTLDWTTRTLKGGVWTATNTPTADGHIANKKYVDDNAPGAATTTTAGLVEKATDEEASAGTNTTHYVTPYHLKTYGGGGGGAGVQTIHCKDAASWLTRTPTPTTTNALDGAGEVVHCWNGIDGDASQAKSEIRPWTYSSASGTTYTVVASGHASGDLSATNVALVLNIEGSWVATGAVVNTTGMTAANYKTYARQTVTNSYAAVGSSFSVFPMGYAPSGTNGEITVYDYMDISVTAE